jgi:hypothetical protein
MVRNGEVVLSTLHCGQAQVAPGLAGDLISELLKPFGEFGT